MPATKLSSFVRAALALACWTSLALGCDKQGNEHNSNNEIVACCGVESGCAELRLIDCVDRSGTPLDGVSSCANDPCTKGACCNAGSCLTTTEAGCAHRYQGDRSTCESGVCSQGACCFDEAEVGLSCDDVRASSCTELGGTWQGLDTACEPTRPCGGTPTMGACCPAEGSCTIDDETECLIAGGSFAGTAVECTPGLCASGACCDQIGGCTETAPHMCFDEFQGLGTRCDSISCTPVDGACCLDDGTCLDLADELQCLNFDGTFQGGGSSCLGTLCPKLLGACCLESEACVELTEEDCIAQTPPLTTSFQGEGFPCSEFLCQNPPGACCIAGQCQVTGEQWCLDSNGVFLGANMQCSHPEVAAMCSP